MSGVAGSGEPPRATRPRGTCRSCGAGILWGRTLTGGRWIPLDWPANPAGNVELVGQHAGALAHAGASLTEARERAERGELELYMPHHATCPDADQWRST